METRHYGRARLVAGGVVRWLKKTHQPGVWRRVAIVVAGPSELVDLRAKLCRVHPDCTLSSDGRVVTLLHCCVHLVTTGATLTDCVFDRVVVASLPAGELTASCRWLREVMALRDAEEKIPSTG